MRDDIKRLLGLIGQPDFSYRDFDPGARTQETGYWPLLEAVALHPALARRNRRERAAPAAAPQPHADAAVTQGLFGRISRVVPPPDPATADPAGSEAASADIRTLLRRLSDTI